MGPTYNIFRVLWEELPFKKSHLGDKWLAENRKLALWLNEPKIRDFYDWCINPLEALFKWQILYVGPITPYGYFQHSEKQPGFYDSAYSPVKIIYNLELIA